LRVARIEGAGLGVYERLDDPRRRTASPTTALADGEYATFDTMGVPTMHLDNDTVYDPGSPGLHTITGDLECGGTTRSILCCHAACVP